MNDPNTGKRTALIRNSLIFQLKLLADGTRDFIMVPISLVATVIGLARGGDEPGREFNRVIELGRQSDQWINLFGNHEPLEEGGKVGSIDMLLSEAENVVRQQAREGGISRNASQAIEKALDAAHRKARGEDRPTDI
ncbi:MAG: hypothetical protein HKO64_08345 [Xanthomonadales bacterium]|nr:hypothetical protein [Gammaproteobacteria bacterium]NNE04273.1 hypothetical protein [Xanthomonadales bacterium]NNL95617.1 hypothetical protein [Xanthomonadales bacterium]